MLNGDIDTVQIEGEIISTVSLEGDLLPIGPKGDKGDPGFSPIVTTSKSGKTTTIQFETATGNVYAYIQDGADGQGSGDMLKEVYDQNNNGIVDNAEKVNNHTVEKDVPSDAVFTDSNAVWGNITGTLSNQSDLSTALGGKVNTSSVGVANGIAELDVSGKVPSSQLPSFVDDVIEGYYYNEKFYQDSSHTIEITGETGKIYVDILSNKTYRWGGSAFVEISSSLALGETSATAYRGDRGKIAYDHSQTTSGNPHNVSKSDVGLGNVGNFKAVSTEASQGLSSTEQENARTNIGAISRTDYAVTNGNGGAIKVGNFNARVQANTGQLYAANLSNDEYESANDNSFIAKGVLEKRLKINGLKIGASVDTNYKTNLLSSNNLLNNSLSINGAITVNSTSEALDMNTNALTSSWIPCKPNTTYILSGEYNKNRWQTKSKDGTITYAGQEGATLTTNSTAKYLRVYYYYNDGGPISPTSKNTMLNEGSTALSYEPFIQNTINVNNEKYTDTINIGTEINTKNRMNVLYSKNLCGFSDGQQTINDVQITYTNGEINLNGTASASGFCYIYLYDALPKGTYTLSANNTQTTSADTKLRINNDGNFQCSLNTTMAYNTQTFNQDITFITIRVDNGITYDNFKIKPQIEKGSQATTYQPFVRTSINIDGNEIYSRPVVLWTNSSPTSDFAGQEITLSDNLSNYSYYEILWLFAKNNNYELTTGKVETNRLAFLGTVSSSGGNLVGYRRLIDSVSSSGNKITFGGGSAISPSGTSENNSICIPYKVIGYK